MKVGLSFGVKFEIKVRSSFGGKILNKFKSFGEKFD